MKTFTIIEMVTLPTNKKGFSKMNISDLYTAIDIYFICNEDATMQKWNELSNTEKNQYEELAERYNS